MALLELNPLPPGSYWVDVPAPMVGSFGQWTARAAAAGVLRVAATHTYPNGGVWVRFDVLTPGVKWEGPGVPNLAGPRDMSPDAAHAPPGSEPAPPTTFQRIEQGLEQTLETIDVVAVVILGLALLKFFKSDR